MEEAALKGCRRMLLLGLFLAYNLLETDLPKKVSGKIQAEPVVQSLGHSIIQRFLSDGDAPMGKFSLTYFYLRLNENFKQRAVYSLRMVFTPTVEDLQDLPLPAPFSFLYYFTHPLRLLGKYGFDSVKGFLRV